MKNLQTQFAVLLLSTVCWLTGAHAQITPSQDAYTNSADPTINYGAAVTLGVVSSAPSIQTTYIQFDLSSIPAGYTSANIAKATLKLYVNAVTTAGSFNVDYVNGTWTEKTIKASLAPALGSTIVASVPLISSNVHDYVLIDVTAAVDAWLNGTQTNDGIALVANSPLSATIDSKESTTQSHPAELDVVFNGAIAGITTASGSGLTGGGTSGTLNLSLTNICVANQVLQYNGSSWGCAAVGTGTVTSVASGTGLTGGPIIGSGTLSIDTNAVPLLAANNTFTGDQTFNNDVLISASCCNGGSLIAYSSNTVGQAINGAATAATGSTIGVLGQSSSSAGFGVEGSSPYVGVYGTGTLFGIKGYSTGSGGAAGAFLVNSGGTILQGVNNSNGVTEFTVDSLGDVTAAGAVSGSSFQLSGQLFDVGSYANENAFLGFAGSPTANATASSDTAVGYGVLSQDTSLGGNTAIGWKALASDTSGIENTAIGMGAGTVFDNTNLTGGLNTALGALTFFSTGTLTNATAVGAYAEVAESNALVLGSFAASATCQKYFCSNTNVGIGTAAPGFLLEVYAAGASNAQIEMASTGTDAAISVNNKASGGREYWIDSGSGGAGIGAGNFAVYDRTAGATRLAINQNGQVGIGTTAPDNALTVNGSADKPGGGSWGTYSDGRLKTVNGGFTAGLSQIMKIHPVHYRYKPDNAMGIRDTDEHIGVVAQEVKQVIPEAVTENSKGYLLVNNDPIIWTMLNAIKEQQGEFKLERAELAKALRRIKQQQNLLRTQSAAMRSLEAEVRETRETLRKVKAQTAASQLTVLARK